MYYNNVKYVNFSYFVRFYLSFSYSLKITTFFCVLTLAVCENYQRVQSKVPGAITRGVGVRGDRTPGRGLRSVSKPPPNCRFPRSSPLLVPGRRENIVRKHQITR